MNAVNVGEKWDNRRTAALGKMNLERPVFDFVVSPFLNTSKTLLGDKNAVTEGCVRG